MKFAPLFAGALLSCASMSATAAELTLFGQQLRTVDRETLTASAEAAGAKLTKSTEASDVFDAKALGLPGAISLDVVYLNGKVVMAQYKLDKNGSTDESFRKMLVSKYGRPTSADRVLGVTPPSEFDKQRIGHGKYRWKFDSGMELVFSLEFFGDRALTYVNKPSQEKMRRLLDAAERKRAGQAASAKRDVF